MYLILLTIYTEDNCCIKILYHGLSKGALLCLKVESMLSEDVEDSYYDSVVLLLGLATTDEDFTHVDDHDY